MTAPPPTLLKNVRDDMVFIQYVQYKVLIVARITVLTIISSLLCLSPG